MELTFSVLLWVSPGQEELFVKYEDRALEIALKYGASVISRVRRNESGDTPYEVQLLKFPNQSALEAFMGDPERQALSEMREKAVAKMEVIQVDQIQ